MKDRITPEEKLLKLIRGQKKQHTETDKQITAIAPELKRHDGFSMPVLRPKLFPVLGLKKIIYAFFYFSCLYLVFSFIFPMVFLRKINLPQMTQGKIKEPPGDITKKIRPFEFYQKNIGDRRIFNSVSGPGSEKPNSGFNVDAIKEINLVGVISGENPQAVVEDKKTQKTYYLTKGQFIGEFEVQDILEGKIILNYKGQKYELYL